MNPKTPQNPKGAGRPKRPAGTSTTAGDRRNVTLSRIDADALNAFQVRLSRHLGIELTLGQCIRWLVVHAEEALPPKR